MSVKVMMVLEFGNNSPWRRPPVTFYHSQNDIAYLAKFISGCISTVFIWYLENFQDHYPYEPAHCSHDDAKEI